MTPKPVLATYVASIPASHAKGAFRFFAVAVGAKTEVAGIIYRCAACAEVSTVGFTRATRPGAGVWPWNGNRHAPSLHRPVTCPCGASFRLTRGTWEPSA